MHNENKLLAIETSGELCSVALTFSPDVYDERNIVMKHIHSEKLIPIIKDLLNSNQMSSGDLDVIAVSKGPGSFTGLRIGMTAAKGIAFTANLPIVPVPTFYALGLEISCYIKNDSEFYIINNANLEECYYSKFLFEEEKIKIIEEPQLKAKTGIDDNLAVDNLVFGNLKGLKGIKNISSPGAYSIAKWTYLFGEDLLTFDFDYLEPNYLKNFKAKQKK